MSNVLTESEIEQLALDILRDENGYTVLYGPDLAEGAHPERAFTDVMLPARLRTAIDRLNPHIPAAARDDAFKKALRAPALTVIENNEAFHRLLTDGIDVKFSVGAGKSRTDKVWLVDFAHPDNNEFLAVNQFTVVEGQNNKRPDIVLFVNGLPLVVLELKNAADEHADLQAAFRQLQTYQQAIPALFTTNAFLVISDGWFAKAGTISSHYARFMEWKSVDGGRPVDAKYEAEMTPLIKGLLNTRTLLDVIRHFIVFEKPKEQTVKKVAAYHQYFAVNKALASTIRATAGERSRTTHEHGQIVAEHPSDYGLPGVDQQPKGDQRAGVIWHTQGSGKSLSMVFYAGKLALAPEMNNPTIVVLTDRNDLDQQLFETFANCQQLLRQTPVQASSRDDLKRLLAVASGGIVFTTIQKFLPPPDVEEGREAFTRSDAPRRNENFTALPDSGEGRGGVTERRNVVVIADEAHRSQYDFIDGFARHIRDALPNATFIGFTGTPLEKEDKNTQAVFGNYVDVYDIQQAVEDGATVRIYYESRLAKIELPEADQNILDERVEEVTESDELTEKQQRFARWARKEAVVGSANRLKQVAADIVRHFEQRLRAADGKGMIVGMSRRICVALHKEIITLRPNWYDPADDKGAIKIVMTGSASDPLDWQEHIRNKDRRKALGNRLKDPTDPLKLIIVRDMFLTGFDAPCLHTMYVDKPMNGHTLMQAIARVNRVFGDKAGGLVVDYIGIAPDLKNAMLVYAASQGKGQIAFDQAEAVARMQELYEVVVDMFQTSSACVSPKAQNSRGAVTFSEKGCHCEESATKQSPKTGEIASQSLAMTLPSPQNLTALLPGGKSDGFDYRRYFTLEPKHKLNVILDAANYIAELTEVKDGHTVRNGKERFKQHVTRLQQAFGLAAPHPHALAIRDDLAFFQAIKARFAKLDDQTKTRTNQEIETALRQIVNDAILSSEVIDIFDAAGLKKPDISILSDEFLADIQGMERKNLALELLKRLLNDDIKTRAKMNMVQSRKFSEMLAEAVKRYQNGLIDSAQVIAELIQLAQDLRAADQRGEKLNMRPDELAFFDALADNPTAEAVLGDQTLKHIAYELVAKVRQNTSLDWQLKAGVQAKLRVLVKRILRKYKYPPDDPATGEYTVSVTKVLDQAELLADYWTQGSRSVLTSDRRGLEDLGDLSSGQGP